MVVWEDGGGMPACGAQVSTVDMDTQGGHARARGLNRRGVLVQEGATIHSVNACEAGMSVQGILGVSALRPRI